MRLSDRQLKRFEEDGFVVLPGLFAPATVLIFGDCLVHSSSINMSPWPRRVFSVIINPISNALKRDKRLDYQHHRDLTPVTPLADDCLLAGAVA